MNTTTATRAIPFVPPAPPKTPKAAGSRRTLLEVAGRLFVERGYDAVSMREIGAAAGLTKGAVYGHFRSKGQLLVEVIRTKIARRDGSGAFADSLQDPEDAVGLLYEERAREIHLLEVDAAAASRRDADVRAGITELYLERDVAIHHAIADLTRDPETAAWVISAVDAGIAMKRATGLPFPDAERLQAEMLAALRGLR